MRNRSIDQIAFQAKRLLSSTWFDRESEGGSECSNLVKFLCRSEPVGLRGRCEMLSDLLQQRLNFHEGLVHHVFSALAYEIRFW